MAVLHRIFHISFLQSNNFQRRIFKNKNLTNEKEKVHMATMFFVKLGRNEEILYYTGHLIDAACKSLLDLAKWFQRRKFLEIDHPEIRITYGSHISERIGTTRGVYIENLLQMPHTKFRFIWSSGFSGEDF